MRIRIDLIFESPRASEAYRLLGAIRKCAKREKGDSKLEMIAISVDGATMGEDIDD